MAIESKPSKEAAKNKSKYAKLDADLSNDLRGSSEPADLIISLLCECVRQLKLIEKNTKK